LLTSGSLFGKSAVQAVTTHTRRQGTPDFGGL
jgi:hypothetical protein